MSTNPTPTGDTAGTPAPGGEMLVLTPAAVTKLLGYQAENPEFQGKAFRIFIEGGGCSGFPRTPSSRGRRSASSSRAAAAPGSGTASASTTRRRTTGASRPAAST
ncbi:MAG: Iron-sulfur cluster biosynthesis [Acidobacteria bacterium]|nr:Iron-sulfur cluster biosynthesis [Acidobacteriota bacterium]